MLSLNALADLIKMRSERVYSLARELMSKVSNIDIAFNLGGGGCGKLTCVAGIFRSDSQRSVGGANPRRLRNPP